MPPLAALLYPFLLAAFHANIAPVISGQSAEPALQSAAATLFLLLAFAAPIVALLGAMTLGELAAPSVTQRRAHTIALLAGAAPPVLVALLLFQVGSGVYLATHSDVRPMDRFRTFQIASGIFLAAYVLGHMNSVFVFARLYLGIDSDWAFAIGAPSGLIKDAWNIRLVPHYGLAVFFVLSHLAAGGRSVLLAHGVGRGFSGRFLIAAPTAAGLVGLCI